MLTVKGRIFQKKWSMGCEELWEFDGMTMIETPKVNQGSQSGRGALGRRGLLGVNLE
jgi:hypothetical protein